MRENDHPVRPVCPWTTLRQARFTERLLLAYEPSHRKEAVAE
jgi:hypothetical protein